MSKNFTFNEVQFIIFSFMIIFLSVLSIIAYSKISI